MCRPESSRLLGEVADFMEQHIVVDSILLTLARPLAMDSFTLAEPAQ